MPARAMWRAEICVGEERVPVRLYAAAQDRKVHFRLLHRADMTPVQQQMVDPGSGEPVPREEIRRGIEVDKGMFVLLTEEELQELEPAPSREIHVEQVIAPSKVDARWLDRPYYLGPDGDEQGYFALAEALAGRGRIGIARWVMRKKRYQGALVSHDGYLLLQTLRDAAQMVGLERVHPSAGRAPEPGEQDLAEQLVATLEGPFEPAAYRDEYRARVEELIAAKAEGRQRPFPKREERAAEGSLAEALEASLSASREAAGGR